MARRRMLQGIIGGALAGLGSGIEQDAVRRRETADRRKAVAESAQLSMLPLLLGMAQDVSSGEKTAEEASGMHSALSEMVRSMGAEPTPFDFNRFQPTGERAAAPVRGKISSAQTPEQVPTDDEILRLLQELPGGDKMTAPVYGEMRGAGNLPSKAMPGTPGPEAPLPSSQFGPVEPRMVRGMKRFAAGRRNELLADESAAAERGFGRELGQIPRRDAAQLPGQRNLAEMQAGVTTSASEASERRMAPFRREQSVLERTDPRIGDEQIRIAQAIAREQQRLQRDFGNVQPGPFQTVSKDEQLFGRGVGGLVPAGSQGYFMFDQQGNKVGFVPGKPLSSQLTPVEIMQQMQGLNVGTPASGGGGQREAIQREMQQIQEEINRLMRERQE